MGKVTELLAKIEVRYLKGLPQLHCRTTFGDLVVRIPLLTLSLNTYINGRHAFRAKQAITRETPDT